MKNDAFSAHMKKIGKRGCQGRLKNLTREQRIDFARMGQRALQKKIKKENAQKPA